MADEIPDIQNRGCEFLALMGKHEFQIAACVHALVPSWHDAEDIIQEVRLQLWREFENFQAGTDFLAWARTIARYAVRKHITLSRRKPLAFSGDVEDALMSKIAGMPKQQADRRLDMLAKCVRRLGNDALNLLRRRYVDNCKIKDVAAELGRSQAGTYQAISRARRELLECVREHLRREDAS